MSKETDGVVGNLLTRMKAVEKENHTLKANVQAMKENNERLSETAEQIIANRNDNYNALSDIVRELIHDNRKIDLNKQLKDLSSWHDMDRRVRFELQARVIALETNGLSTETTGMLKNELQQHDIRLMKVENPEFDLPSNYKVVPLQESLHEEDVENNNIALYVDDTRALFTGYGRHDIDLDKLVLNKLLKDNFKRLAIFVDGECKTIVYSETTQSNPI